MTTTPRIAVLGAGGRAGSALGRELLARGLRVTGVVRDPRRHDELRRTGFDLAAGDATSAADLTAPLHDVAAVVIAVSPFTAPPPSFDGFDESFFERLITAVLDAAAPTARVLAVGLFAALPLADGRRVMDDAALFPPEIRPFARAHARQLRTLRERAGDRDWAILSPPAGLRTGPATGGYALLTGPFEVPELTGELSYDQLAGALADELVAPTVHQAQVAVVEATTAGAEKRVPKLAD